MTNKELYEIMRSLLDTRVRYAKDEDTCKQIDIISLRHIEEFRREVIYQYENSRYNNPPDLENR